MNKKLICMSIPFIFLFFLSACGEKDSQDNEGLSGIGLNLVQSEQQDDTLSSGETSKKTLSISVCWDHYDIEEAVKSFNQLYPDIEITVNKYANDEEKYKVQIVTNLMAGTSDDILDGTGLPYVRLADSKLLTGLYPLMENDTGFSKDDYYMNAFESLNYMNEVYVFPVNFAYNMIGVNNTLGSELVSKFSRHDTITYRNMLNLYVETPNISGFYLQNNFSTYYVIAGNIDQFIDYENKTCDFDNEEFISLITDAKNATESVDAGNSSTYGTARARDELSAKKYLFKNVTSTGYQYFLPYKEFSDFVNFIPVANPKGQIYIYPVMRFCISEQAENKELAWEFLKFLTTPEANESPASGDFFSVSKGTFMKNTALSMDRWISALESQGYYLNGDKQKHIENVTTYLDQYNQLPMCSPPLEEYLEIVGEVTELFDKGVMTAEQVASDLQNKISLSLME